MIFGELTANYRSAFPEIGQFRRFSELVSAMDISGERRLAHLNSLIPDHANRSSMNRFLASGMDTDMIFRIIIVLINSIGKDGIPAIDDTIVEKTGGHTGGASWIFDHSKGRNVFGMQFATSVLSAEYGIYSISAGVYRRFELLRKGNRKIKIGGGDGPPLTLILQLRRCCCNKDILEHLSGMECGWRDQGHGPCQGCDLGG